MGRRSKLTPEMHTKIIALIKAGNYIETACEAIGVHKGTYYNWHKQGEREYLEVEKLKKARKKIPKKLSESIFLDFFNAIKVARAVSEAKYLDCIRKAADGGAWQAAAWFLERTRFKQYGRKEAVQLTGEDGEPIKAQIYLPDNKRNGPDSDNDKEV